MTPARARTEMCGITRKLYGNMIILKEMIRFHHLYGWLTVETGTNAKKKNNNLDIKTRNGSRFVQSLFYSHISLH